MSEPQPEIVSVRVLATLELAQSALSECLDEFGEIPVAEEACEWIQELLERVSTPEEVAE